MAQKMAASTVDPAWAYGAPMEPIPEEEDYEAIGSTTNVSRASQQSPGKAISHVITDNDGIKRILEQKERTREIITTEQVQTLKRSVNSFSFHLSLNLLHSSKTEVDIDKSAQHFFLFFLARQLQKKVN